MIKNPESQNYRNLETIVIPNDNPTSSLHGSPLRLRVMADKLVRAIQLSFKIDHTHKACDDALGGCLISNKNDYIFKNIVLRLIHSKILGSSYV